jgi:hypothetical protein
VRPQGQHVCHFACGAVGSVGERAFEILVQVRGLKVVPSRSEMKILDGMMILSEEYHRQLLDRHIGL